MRKFKHYFFLFTFFTVTNIVFCQKKKDNYVSFNIGSSYYIGDLAPISKQLTNIYLQPSASVSLGYSKFITHTFAISSTVSINSIFSDDNILNQNAKDLSDLRSFARGLHFKNDIVSLNILGEYAPLRTKKKKTSPYISSGLSVFYSNPKAKISNVWVELKPLNLNVTADGVPKSYNKFNLGVPIVLGYPILQQKRFEVYFEVSTLITFTDFLDDVNSEPLNPSLLQPGMLQFFDRSQEPISAYSGIDRTELVNEYNKKTFNLSYQNNPFSSKIKGFGGFGDVRGDSYSIDLVYSCQFKIKYNLRTRNRELDCPRLR